MQDGPEKPPKLHYVQLFNVKLNGLQRSVRVVQGSREYRWGCNFYVAVKYFFVN